MRKSASRPLRERAARNAALAALLVAWGLPACVPGSDLVTYTPDPVSSPHWADDMARFAELDARTTPPISPIVFTGSSSVRMWSSLETDFPARPLLNRGFGGSQIRDATWFADELVVRYRPRQVVIYAGDNDIDAGRTPGQVLADFHGFVSRIRRDLPDVPIAWVAIKPSLARAAQIDEQRAANALVKEAATKLSKVAFIDVFTPMLDENGNPRPELFIDDGLHLSPAGYAIWRQIIAPFLVGAGHARDVGAGHARD